LHLTVIFSIEYALPAEQEIGPAMLLSVRRSRSRAEDLLRIIITPAETVDDSNGEQKEHDP
jgi:hypothetical protein